MSGLLPHRSAVFLDEMGVGVLWRLRGRAVAAPEAHAEQIDAAAAAAPAAAPASAAAAAAVVPAPPASQHREPPAPPSAAWDAAPAPLQGASTAPAAPHAPQRDAPTAHAAPAPLRDAPAAHAAPHAPQSVPPSAAAPRPPAEPSAPAESAWDDAPASPELQRAASQPPQPVTHKVPAPARPAQPAQTPSTRSAPVESAWDDEPSVTPAARPARIAGSGPVSDEEIAQMDWPTLRACIDSCTRCKLCQTREAAVNGRGDEQASWIVLDAAPNADDEEYAEPVTGNPGRLLDNMLRAVNQSTQQGAYITTLVKCRPQNEDGSQRAATPDELSACRPYLQRELQLTQAKVMVAVGHAAGKGLLGAAARGRIMLHGETPVVATFHPADLLKRPEEKAKAWADLCLAKSAHAGRR